MNTDLSLRRLEAMLDEIEALDRASNGAFRQASDREAYDLAARIERKMLQKLKTGETNALQG